MGPVILNYNFKNNYWKGRNEIEDAGRPTVFGNDSTENKEALPGQWTLVKRNQYGKSGTTRSVATNDI